MGGPMPVRTDVAASGAVWTPTLEWYARAVRELSQRPISDRRSWRYLAAIHGISPNSDSDPSDWIARGIIAAGDPLPPNDERRRLWDQCQHAGWYFLPWHRGYLWAFEAIVAQTVRDLGGPDDWGLPYWNYFDTSNPNARRIPQAFLDRAMPDGSPNPLAAPPRDGSQVLGPTPAVPVDITLDAMGRRRFTSAPGTLGFGGGRTSFLHLGGNRTGALESDPHNLVHVMVGGDTGYMSDPNYAALDPIFWLHHCNIDRLWAAWLTRSGNTQENGTDWTNGPFPRRFTMPDAAGELADFTPGNTLPGGSLAPTYDDVNIGTGAPVVVAGVAEVGGVPMPATLSDAPPPEPTLLGSSTETLTAGAAPATTRVTLTVQPATMAASPVERRWFLNLRNVRGAAPTGVLNVYVGMPATAEHGAVEPVAVKTVALFGLAKASSPEGPHAGNGLGVSIDITETANALMARTRASLDQLEVRIEQPGAAAAGGITVDNVTVVSQPAE